MDKPEAAQLYQSIINYMDSKDFNPNYVLTNYSIFLINVCKVSEFGKGKFQPNHLCNELARTLICYSFNF